MRPKTRTEIRDGKVYTVTVIPQGKGIYSDKVQPQHQRPRARRRDEPIEHRTKFPFKAKINGVERTVWPDWIE